MVKTGFAIYDFPLAAPGPIVVQVVFPVSLPEEKEGWLKSQLDAYYRECRDSDLFHLRFQGALRALQIVGLVSSVKDKVAVPRPSFAGYRCAYQGISAPAPAPAPKEEQQQAEKVKTTTGKPEPEPSPLDALLRPGAWDQTVKRVAEEQQQPPAPREPLQTLEEAAEMRVRLEHIWDEVPDGMVAE